MNRNTVHKRLRQLTETYSYIKDQLANTTNEAKKESLNDELIDLQDQINEIKLTHYC